MSKIGVVIFPNGEKIPFGKKICIDEEDYLKEGKDIGHQKSFENEVLVNKEFENYYYNENDNFWGKSVPLLSKQGLIILLNSKDYSDEVDKVIGFVPEKPTPMQLVALENYLSANMFSTPDNVLHELFNDEYGNFYDENDFIKYDGLEEYVKEKNKIKIR